MITFQNMVYQTKNYYKLKINFFNVMSNKITKIIC